jgi:hypothetical protein
MAINDRFTVSGIVQSGITISSNFYELTGTKDFTFTMEFINSDLTGDGGITYGQLSKPTGKTTFDAVTMIMPLPALAAMMGITAVDTGATPNQIRTYTFLAGQCLSSFEYECRATCVENQSGVGSGTEPGDVHLVFSKCKIAGSPALSFPEKDYAQITFPMAGFADKSTSEFFKIIMNETAAVIS